MTVGIAQSAACQAHIMNILESQTYSDPILAPLREYSTNAFDAHVESGIRDTPIQIHLPTELEPFLSVRDFGKGLSISQVRDIYTQFGASTKRDSNEVNGMLGIGCKSAWAYGDAFIVTSWFMGEKTSYSMHKEKGERVCQIINKENCPISETGVEIRMNVKSGDIWEFRKAAKNLFWAFEVRPELNVELEYPTFEKDVFGLFEDWGGLNDSAYVIMANVPYPLNFNILQKEVPEFCSFIGQSRAFSRAVFRAKTGEVSFSASRESLSYDSMTLGWFKKRLAEFKIKFLKDLQKSIDDQPTNIEKAMLAKKYQHDFKILGEKPLVNGEAFDETNYYVPCDFYSVNYKTGRFKISRDIDRKNVLRDDNLAILTSKDGPFSQVPSKINFLKDEGFNYVILCLEKDLTDPRFEGLKTLNFDELKAEKKERKKSTTSGIPCWVRRLKYSVGDISHDVYYCYIYDARSFDIVGCDSKASNAPNLVRIRRSDKEKFEKDVPDNFKPVEEWLKLEEKRIRAECRKERLYYPNLPYNIVALKSEIQDPFLKKIADYQNRGEVTKAGQRAHDKIKRKIRVKYPLLSEACSWTSGKHWIEYINMKYEKSQKPIDKTQPSVV